MTFVPSVPVDDLRRQAVDLFNKGMKKADIARALGVTPGVMQTWLPSPDLAGNLDLAARMQERSAAGLPHAHIAREFGISRAMVSAIIGPANPPAAHSNDAEIHVLGSVATFDTIRAIAKSFNAITYQGRGAGKGSIAVLLKMIADGDLIVSRPDDPDAE